VLVDEKVDLDVFFCCFIRNRNRFLCHRFLDKLCFFFIPVK